MAFAPMLGDAVAARLQSGKPNHFTKGRTRRRKQRRLEERLWRREAQEARKYRR